MVIAIDGPAGVGKSSIAKMIADKLGVYYLNSGNFYRAVTLRMLENNYDVHSHDDRVKCSKDADCQIINGRFFLDGKDVEDNLHTREIDLCASYVSSDPSVREEVNKKIYDITGKLSIICEGRDMTTVVFPDAEYKFYFDADPQIRAQRRFLQKPDGMTVEQILAQINERDHNDKNKVVGSLKVADDAVYVDTSYLTINQVCDKVLNYINTCINK